MKPGRMAPLASLLLVLGQPPAPAAMSHLAANTVIDCKPWGCCCDGYADYFGGIAGKCLGCAPGNVSDWWGDNHCNSVAASGVCCDGPYCHRAGAAAPCSVPPPVGPPTTPNWTATYRMNESTIVMPCDYKGFVSDMPGWAETASKFAVLDLE